MNKSITYIKKFLIEALVVGLSVAVVGSFFARIFMLYNPDKASVLKVQNINKGNAYTLNPWDLPWNNYYFMELSLFVTGLSLHFLFEITGANKWYLQHAAAGVV